MNIKIERFFIFIKKEEIRNFFACIFYISFIVLLAEIEKINLQQVLEFVINIILTIIFTITLLVYLPEWRRKIRKRIKGKLGKTILKETKTLSKELLMFIPILALSIYIALFILVGKPVNQTNIESSFYDAPISNSIYMIIIAPIIEEFIFRFLPYRFIKNKTLYIILSAIIFAGTHVINDTNPFYYIWGYMLISLYLGYRYYETKDILVPISMHSLNNLVTTLLFVLS